MTPFPSLCPLSQNEVRICFTSGGWQLIALCASLRAHALAEPDSSHVRTVLAVAGPGVSQPMRETIERFALALGACQALIWIDDLVADLSRLDDQGLRRVKRAVRERLGVSDPVEVWLSYPHAGPDRLLMESYPEARIIIYEDGLLTYARPWRDGAGLRHRTMATLRYLAAQVRGDGSAEADAFRSEVRLFGWPSRDAHATYLILGDRLGIPQEFRPSARGVDPAILREVLRDTLVDAPARPRASGRRALLLGGNYSTWDLMPRADELRFYTRMTASLSEAGYAVWWKDHPRVSSPFLPEIRTALPGVPVHEYESDHTLPLEVVLQYDPVDLIVGSLSSSLLYGPLICGDGMRAATFAGTVRPLLVWPWTDVANVIEAAVPSVDELLAGQGVSAPGGNLRG
jgi:hypothetical protein